MEEIKNVVVDVSSFFLFEATGDSSEVEINNDPNVVAAAANIDNHHRLDDDAESCSCDISDSFPFESDVNGSCDIWSCVDHEEKEEEEEGGEEAHSSRRWSSENNNKKRKENKKKKNRVDRDGKKSSANVSVDSCEEIMTETEKNRLFWESCLAS